MKIVRNLAVTIVLVLATMVAGEQPLSAHGATMIEKQQQCQVVPQGVAVWDPETEFCEHDVVHGDCYCMSEFWNPPQYWGYGVCYKVNPYGPVGCGSVCSDPPPGSQCA